MFGSHTDRRWLRQAAWRASLALVVMGLGAWGNLVQAQNTVNWRVYHAADGLRESFTSAVTIGPKGTVWVGHGDTDAFSWLDGYSVGYVPSTAGGNYHIAEGRAGQIWSPYTQGLQEYHREGQWTAHPILEIRQENQQNILRRVRQISVLPVEWDRALFLVSDRLMEYNAANHQASTLRHVNQTQLGKFWDLLPARDGGAWITGARGLAKLAAPTKRLSAQTEWRELLIPERLQVQNLQRPMEDDQGEITAIGDSTLMGRKVMVHCDGQNWLTHHVPGENIRQAWRGLDGTFWLMSINSLHRVAQQGSRFSPVESFFTGQNYEVATDNKGIFWLATSVGLMRYSPLPWRQPWRLPALQNSVHGIQEDRAGQLWFVTVEHLIRYHEGHWQIYPLPKEGEGIFQKDMLLFVQATGQVALNINQRLFLFSPQTEAFTAVLSSSGRPVKILGQLKDGKLCVQEYDAETGRTENQLSLYDGRAFQPWLPLPPMVKSNEELQLVFPAQNGDVWLGSVSGLARYHEQQWHAFGAAERYLADGVNCLLELEDGKWWSGGREKIQEFDGKTWRVLKMGFDRVHAMVWSGGAAWVASGSGLYRYANDTWAASAIEEGLPSATVYDVHIDQRGQAWAGTSRGLSRYHLDADVDPPKTTVARMEPRVQPSADGTLAIRFNGEDKWKYTASERLLYSYRIDTGTWSPFSAVTTATFTNLAAGNHRFAVKAMDRNWNEEPVPALVEFMVVLPWFKDPRLIAISAAGLAVILFFAGLAFNRHGRLKRSYAEVEQIVAQRTQELELANQELLHSQKMRALGTLAAGIAHDFNNILSIIKGSVQIIDGNLEDKDKIHTRVKRIRTVVDQGAAIVKAMLGYSRAGVSQFTTYNLHEVLDETIKLLGDRFVRDINIRLESEASTVCVRGARDLMQQLLLNLILNAADALAGHGEIVLRTGHLRVLPEPLVLHPAPAEEWHYVAVMDHGSGIPPDVLPRIFEPFYSTKALSTKRGTGLGLYMVYEFAKEMNYGIKVDSTVGQGTTFTILLPLPPSKEAA